MISTRKEMNFYIQEDSWRNGVDFNTFIGKLKYHLKLFLGSESASVFRYLKCLRHLEYHLNNKTNNVFHWALAYYYKMQLCQLGAKYHIQILPNTVGYGLAILHLSGGGGYYST